VLVVFEAKQHVKNYGDEDDQGSDDNDEAVPLALGK